MTHIPASSRPREWNPLHLLARLGWIVVTLLVLLALSSVVARFADTMGVLVQGRPAKEHPFDGRYQARPILTLIHIIAGAIFLVIGPFQFMERFRTRHWKLHRLLGKIFIVTGVISAVTALIFVAVLPVFGSFSSSVAVTFGSLLFLFSIGRAYALIRRRQVKLHREWMIRSYALGLGIATFRLLLPILMAPPLRASFVEAWDTVTWLGFSINLLVAECWINLTRSKKT